MVSGGSAEGTQAFLRLTCGYMPRTPCQHNLDVPSRLGDHSALVARLPRRSALAASEAIGPGGVGISDLGQLIRSLDASLEERDVLEAMSAEASDASKAHRYLCGGAPFG